MVALILLNLCVPVILIALAAFAYLVKTISLFLILAGITVLMFFGFASLLFFSCSTNLVVTTSFLVRYG